MIALTLCQTAGPLILIWLLEIAGRILRRKARKTRQAAADEPKGRPQLSLLLADLCSDVSFFLTFLLFPGSSTKTFHALLCVPFDGEGELPKSFLRVDFSIDCGSTVYRGFIRPYAIIMVVIYPIGVPLYYLSKFWQNRHELHRLRHLELSIANEGQRVQLGSFLEGKELEEYEPEIREAEERKAHLEAVYAEQRNRLPTALKKLTNGYEMRTYWFEFFECCRKILLIVVPIFFEQDSPEQLTIGLIICFITFGMYMMYAPFEDDGDDLLSQLCQLQIFFSLLSSIILKAAPNSVVLGYMLPVMIAVPPLCGLAFEAGLIETIKTNMALLDNGVPTPCGRVGKGWRTKAMKILDFLLGSKQHPKPEEDALASTTADSPAADILPAPASLPAPRGDISTLPPHVVASFKRFDENGDGFLEYHELKQAIASHGIEMSHPRAAEIIKWYDDHVDGRMDVHEYANLIANLQEGITRVGPSKSGAAAAASERSAVILLREIIARDGGQAELDKALAELKRGSAGLSAEQVAKASLHQPAAAQEADSASSSPTTEPSNSMDRIKEQIKSLFPDPGAGSVARTSPAKGSGGDAVAASVEPRDCAPNPDHLSA